MDILMVIVLILAAGVLVFGMLMRRLRKPVKVPPMPSRFREILQADVPFYQGLDETGRRRFEYRVMHFLSTVRITGIRTEVEDIDKIYVAASAIIPIFGFDDWEYINLNEVLLYPGSFNHDFDQEGADRNISGIVGTGALNNTMVLSRHELRQAFRNQTGKSNTAIHEFVHLVDKTDGSVDGIPEFLLDKQFVLPWLKLIQQGIQNIREDRSDINPYGATNQAEFFAVVSEYFFERPDLLENNHPELYALLVKIFRQDPGSTRDRQPFLSLKNGR